MVPLGGSASWAAPAKKDVVAAGKSTVQWVALEDGVKRAAASGKYVFVTVYTDWCGYCRKLNTVTLRAQPVLAELDKNFQSVRVNAESESPVIWKGKKMSEREVAGKAWGVSGFPTMLFLSPKGEIIGSYSAFAEPDLMVNLLTYISSGARERNVSFEDFLGGKG
jgi:thioredoxin-related protein